MIWESIPQEPCLRDPSPIKLNRNPESRISTGNCLTEPFSALMVRQYSGLGLWVYWLRRRIITKDFANPPEQERADPWQKTSAGRSPVEIACESDAKLMLVRPSSDPIKLRFRAQG